jgi:hypothetical protein
METSIDLALKRQKVVATLKPLGPTTRSEWVKELEVGDQLKIQRDLFRDFTPVPPAPIDATTELGLFTTYCLKEEPPSQEKGTRAVFAEIVQKWASSTLTHVTESRNIPTIGTHKPDQLHRAQGRGGEQSVVVIGENKPMHPRAQSVGQLTDFSDEERGQILDFINVCMKLQPWRMFMYGYLSDCRRIQFFHAVRRGDGAVEFSQSDLMIDRAGWNALYRLLSQTLEKLGFEDVSLPGWEIDKYLGSGKTSSVFSAERINPSSATASSFSSATASFPSTAAGGAPSSSAIAPAAAAVPVNVAVCKMYTERNGEEARNREARALIALLGLPHVPTLVDGAPDRTMSARPVLLKTPVGQSLKTDVRLSVAHYAGLVTTLKKAHARDVYHNDIAPDNLFAVLDESGADFFVMLNDFGSAASAAELAGAFTVETRRLFYRRDKQGKIPFGGAEDLRALVRSVFYLTQSTFNANEAETAEQLDAIMFKQLPIWRVALKLAGDADYDALHALLTRGELTR